MSLLVALLYFLLAFSTFLYSLSCLYPENMLPYSSLFSYFALPSLLSSPLLDVCDAQHNTAGRPTYNPLVWRVVAVFIMVSNRCLIILRHAPPSSAPPPLVHTQPAALHGQREE